MGMGMGMGAPMQMGMGMGGMGAPMGMMSPMPTGSSSASAGSNPGGSTGGMSAVQRNTSANSASVASAYSMPSHAGEQQHPGHEDADARSGSPEPEPLEQPRRLQVMNAEAGGRGSEDLDGSGGLL